jgi:hypothetical protein
VRPESETLLSTGIYLPYGLTLPIGDAPLRLYGFAGLRDGEAVFALSSPPSAAGIDAETAQRLFPPDATREIVNPLGLIGVTLDEFELGGRVYRGAVGTTAVDMVVQAAARFPGLPNRPKLSAVMVVDANAVRLVRVALALDRPLTLTDILGSILGRAGTWASVVTDQFAFTAGRLYWLQEPAKGGASSSFSYKPSEAAAPETYTPGYHIEGDFLLFGKYAFTAGLSRSDSGQVLVTAGCDSLDFDFLELDNSTLTIDSAAGQITVAVEHIAVLGRRLASLSATYDTSSRVFTGTVAADLGTLDLPMGAGAVHVALDLTIEWDENGVRLKEIGNLPSGLQPLDTDQLGPLKNLLNQGQDGCEALLDEWFDGLTVTLKPALADSPTRSGDQMVLPLSLAYELSLGDTSIPLSAKPVKTSLSFDIPGDLGALPAAILNGIVGNFGQVLGAMLANPATYAALAIQIGLKAGAKAFARFICRALQRFLDVAKQIADRAIALATDSIAAVAELAAMLISVAMIGVTAIISLLEEIWDKIKSWLGGGDDDQKEQAQRHIRDIQDKVDGAVQSVEAKIADTVALLQVKSLELAVDADSGVCAQMDWAAALDAPWAKDWAASKEIPTLDAGQRLTCTLAFLDSGRTQIFTATPADFPACVPLTRFEGRDYRMNASVQLAISGTTFMDEKTGKDILAAADQVAQVQDDTAQAVAQSLRDTQKRFASLNSDGIQGNIVFATSTAPVVMTVGESLVGFNSRLPEAVS